MWLAFVAHILFLFDNTGSNLCHCPESNRKLELKFSDLRSMLTSSVYHDLRRNPIQENQMTTKSILIT